MKKITSLLLILVMMLTMCTACDTGSSKRDRDRDEDREEREDRDDEDEDEEEDEEIEETEETTESEETLPERTVATTETEATTQPTDETADPVESYQDELDAILGEIDALESEAQGYVDVENNCYVNETIGIRFNIPEGWTYQSAAELAELGEAVGDVIEDTGTGISGGYSGYAYAFLANSPDGAHSINMIHDQNSFYMPGSEQTLITSTLASQDQLIATYEAMGITDASMTESELEIAGETIPTIETTYSYSGITVSTVQFFLIGTGGNYLTVSLQSIDIGSGVSDFDFASAFEAI